MMRVGGGRSGMPDWHHKVSPGVAASAQKLGQVPDLRVYSSSRHHCYTDGVRLARVAALLVVAGFCAVTDARLGVHGPGSDIDTICVCPRHIYREHFFGEFKQMLKEWPAVTEISVSGTVAYLWDG